MPDGAVHLDFDLDAAARDYARDGVVKLPGVVSAEWLARLRAVIDAFRAHDPGAGNTVHYGHGRGRLTMRWMWRTNPAILAWARRSGIAPVIAHIIGARELKLWYDLTFIHSPGIDAEGTPWHHDLAAFPFKGGMNPSFWLAMTEVTAATAPLTCIKGTHRAPKMFRPTVYTDPHLPLPPDYVDQPDWDAKIAAGEVETVWWPLQPGDALLIHPGTVHGAPPMAAADGQRIGFTTRWMGEDVTWRPDAFSMKIPGIDNAQVPVGARPTGPEFPVVWRR
jgi:ectoine hydroxylase-related dioxygenase (phytanoyl-CoA dioxygenase family)